MSAIHIQNPTKGRGKPSDSRTTQSSSSTSRAAQKGIGQDVSAARHHKVEEATEWVNSMVCVDKKNKNKELRICIDPGDLNKNIKHEHYQIPKCEETASEMAGAKYFSKLDAAQGFWQINLDEQSSK